MKKRMISVLTTNVKIGISITLMALMMLGSVFSLSSTAAHLARPAIAYRPHVSNMGWMGDVTNGVRAGTVTKIDKLDFIKVFEISKK